MHQLIGGSALRQISGLEIRWPGDSPSLSGPPWSQMDGTGNADSRHACAHHGLSACMRRQSPPRLGLLGIGPHLIGCYFCGPKNLRPCLLARVAHTPARSCRVVREGAAACSLLSWPEFFTRAASELNREIQVGSHWSIFISSTSSRAI
jgi:hypothetical protein